jgi:hypothetical protein
MYESFAPRVRYGRVPITPNQAPEDKDFDDLVTHLLTLLRPRN